MVYLTLFKIFSVFQDLQDLQQQLLEAAKDKKEVTSHDLGRERLLIFCLYTFLQRS